jgi:hypothetical protein
MAFQQPFWYMVLEHASTLKGFISSFLSAFSVLGPIPSFFPKNVHYKKYLLSLITVNNALFALKKCDIGAKYRYISRVLVIYLNS